MKQELNDYIQLFKKEGLFIETNIEKLQLSQAVQYITYDSKDVREQSIFVCKGAHFLPIYLEEAKENGAICYISEDKYTTEVPHIIVSDVRKAMPLLADFFYGQIWKDLTTIGITGTKGKSTTTYFMKFILDEYTASMQSPKTAILSGIDNYDGVINEESHLTTPEALMLHKHFYNAVKSGIEYLTMEVSSQALKYDRTQGITYDVGCYLNIGEDHISDIEHSDFSDYFNSKLILFKQCKNACINIDAKGSNEAIAACSGYAERVITFGQSKSADICGYDIVKKGKNITFKVKSDSFKDEEIKLSIAGLFNVQNALAAIATCYLLNIPMKYIKAGLKKAQVSGRMEVYYREGSDMKVIVDYAHNKMSFETLFISTQKEYPHKKITIVFGCPGKKALSRRKELGEIAGKYADMVYITEEDAGEESVEKISEEIAYHVKKQNCPCEIIVDREKAISDAVKNGDEDTIILVTGKGRETRQKRGIDYIDCASDVEIVMRLLGKN